MHVHGLHGNLSMRTRCIPGDPETISLGKEGTGHWQKKDKNSRKDKRVEET